MKKCLFLIVGLCLLLELHAQTNQDATSYEIGGIRIIGSKDSDRQAILAMSGLHIGQQISVPGFAIPKAIKALYRQNIFTDIQIYQERTVDNIIFLEIQLKELPKYDSYQLSGLPKSDHKKVEELINAQLVKGTIIGENDKRILQQAIKNYFYEKGYRKADIQIAERVNSKTNRMKLRINIDRKEKVKIAQIDFKGNEIVSSKRLQKLMETKSKKCLFCKGQYLEEQFDIDKDAIERHYRNLGYRDARIVKDSVWETAEAELQVLLVIEEGIKYYVRNINWHGNSIYSDEVLDQVFDIQKGAIFNEELIEQRLRFDPKGRDISTLYLDNGYLFLQLEKVEQSISEDSIDLDIRIMEGPRATIGEVNIRGNERTHENVIRRELRTRPGDKFSRSAIIRSQRELIGLGYFNPEKLDVQTQVNPNEGTVDVTYVVEETNADKIELSAGWNPGSNDVSSGLIGTLGLSLNNFSMRRLFSGDWGGWLPQGDGQTLSFRLQSTGASYQSANITFTEPWLGGKSPTSLTAASFYQRFTNGASTSSETFESLSVLGTSLSVSKPLRWLKGQLISSTELSFQDIQLNKLQDIVLDDGSVLSEGNFNNFYLKQTITYNTIYDPFFPTRGVRVQLSGQFTPPYSLFSDAAAESTQSWLEYHKWRFGADWYVPISKNLVVKSSIKMGWLGNYNPALNASPFERFEMGGNGWNAQQAGFTGNDIFSLRGYEEDYIEGTQNGGGTAFAKMNVELRYQVLNSNMTRAFLLAFVEGGNVWKETSDFNPFDLYRSAGLGLRVQIPMFGTLGFDYGIGFDKPELKGQRWTNFATLNLILGFEPE